MAAVAPGTLWPLRYTLDYSKVGLAPSGAPNLIALKQVTGLAGSCSLAWPVFSFPGDLLTMTRLQSSVHCAAFVLAPRDRPLFGAAAGSFIQVGVPGNLCRLTRFFTCSVAKPHARRLFTTHRDSLGARI